MGSVLGTLLMHNSGACKRLDLTLYSVHLGTPFPLPRPRPRPLQLAPRPPPRAVPLPLRPPRSEDAAAVLTVWRLGRARYSGASCCEVDAVSCFKT